MNCEKCGKPVQTAGDSFCRECVAEALKRIEHDRSMPYRIHVAFQQSPS